jgi:hypothetical protein
VILIILLISMLKEVEILNLHNCSGISSFHGLYHIKDLCIDGYSSTDNEYKFPNSEIMLFNHLKKFTAYEMNLELRKPARLDSDFTTVSWNCFANLRSLVLVVKTVPNTLLQLRSLELFACDHITALVLDLPILSYLKVEVRSNLEIVHLPAVTLYDKTRNTSLTEVELSGCSCVRVIISRRVTDLRLLCCKKLVHLTSKNSVGRLSIVDCPKLKDLKALAPIHSMVFTDKDNLQDDDSLSDYEDDDVTEDDDEDDDENNDEDDNDDEDAD